MRVEHLKYKFPLRDSSQRLMGTGRGAGVHLSDVLNYIDEIDEPGKNFTGNDLYAQLGFMWETMISEVLPRYLSEDIAKHVFPPGEKEKDGILMTPDGMEPSEWALHEYKATWRSMRKLEEDFEHHFRRWLRQIKSYCYVMDTRVAYLVVFFVMGNYAFGTEGGGPQLRVLRLTFTPGEIAENWKMILGNAAEMRRTGWQRRKDR